MNTRQHRHHIGRMAWYQNHGQHVLDWSNYASHHGYTITSVQPGRRTRLWEEVRVSYDGAVVGMLHIFSDETFGFVFTPEKGAGKLREAWWRITHPFAPSKPLPWRRRSEA